MATATTRQVRPWIVACSIHAGLLALPSPATGQTVTCDADRLPALPVPELRISASKAELRTAPETDGKVVITLPQDIKLPLLGRHDGWLVVNYRDGDRYRRLFMSSGAAEAPPAADLGARQMTAQRWSDAHSRICGKVWWARNATKSFIGAAVLASVSAAVWRSYVKDDDGFYFEEDGRAVLFETENRYRKVFAVWTGMGLGAIAGAVYQGIRLRRAKRELSDLGWPRMGNGGVPLPGFRGAMGDLLYDPPTGRQTLVLTWRP